MMRCTMRQVAALRPEVCAQERCAGYGYWHAGGGGAASKYAHLSGRVDSFTEREMKKPKGTNHTCQDGVPWKGSWTIAVCWSFEWRHVLVVRLAPCAGG